MKKKLHVFRVNATTSSVFKAPVLADPSIKCKIQKKKVSSVKVALKQHQERLHAFRRTSRFSSTGWLSVRAACQSVSRCRQIKNSLPPRQVGKLNFHGSKVTNTGVVTHVSERYLQQERPTSDHLHLLLRRFARFAFISTRGHQSSKQCWFTLLTVEELLEGGMSWGMKRLDVSIV